MQESHVTAKMGGEGCQAEITIYKTCISGDNADIAFYWPGVTHFARTFEMIFMKARPSLQNIEETWKKKRKKKNTNFSISNETCNIIIQRCSKSIKRKKSWTRKKEREREQKSNYKVIYIYFFFLRKWKVSR